MEKIAILTSSNRLMGGTNLFFPIYRWEKQLSDEQIKVDFISDHNSQKIFNYKTVIVVHRYFEAMINLRIIKDHEPIKKFLIKLKDKGIKIIFFDAGDSTGSWFFDMMDYVDVFLKKQLLKDKSRYLINEGAKSVRVWMNDYDEATKDNYHVCKKDNLHKLRLAWNLALVDYRYNPFKIGLISNYFFSRLNLSIPSANRKYLTSYRGKLHQHSAYALQRNELIKQLTESNLPVVTGKPIDRKKYLKELEQCKIVVSPFGWGEICYRDFEAFIKGAILVKPDMSHLETFPNLYEPNITYLPIDWQMEQLEDKLSILNERYADFIEIAFTGQSKFNNFYNDAELCVNHFKEIIG